MRHATPSDHPTGPGVICSGAEASMSIASAFVQPIIKPPHHNSLDAVAF